jgi:hypothetical protein
VRTVLNYRFKGLHRILTGVLAAWIFIAGASIYGAYAMEVQGQDAQLKEAQNFEEKWGIKILSLRLTSGGYMLDFRYRVIDPDKAAPLFDRKIKPYLLDQTSGAKFSIAESPKVGALRQTRKPEANRNYFMIFANPGKYVKKGNKVTVAADDFKAENLTVE